MFNEPWFQQLRYYPFSQYLKKRFGCRVHKVTLHAGFTCPNRDGRCGVGGCIYCVNQSFSPVAGKGNMPIREQMKKGMKFLRRRSGAQKFIAYFQPFSNTYADVATLKARYDAALCDDDIVGISIGTRPDCVPDEALDLVQSYTARYEVWLEYGIQSIHEQTLRRINRGHFFDAFEDAVRRTQGRGIKICAHTILGLPGETREDMIETSRAVSDLGIDGVKLHHLYVAKGTPLHEMYDRGEVQVMSAEEYIPLVCDCLEVIRSDVAIQRLVGDTHGGMLVAPIWPQKKSEVFAAISAELRRRDSCQGARCGTSVSAHALAK
ncbi:MAG: TIGR01212 family radical SAM protein [Planctomycetota bacterium]